MKPTVTLETLKSKPLNPKAIEKGTDLFRKGSVEYWPHESGYLFAVDDHGAERRGTIEYTRDGCDLTSHYCLCNPGRNGLICKHIVAATLAIQGGIVKTGVTLEKTATVTTTVSDMNIARSIGSGNLEVFATPMMTALMEQAACSVLRDVLEPGQTSVGTQIMVEHTAPSVIGSVISATATITEVRGRAIVFSVAANDDAGEIGKGTHTRVLVDAVKFMARAKERQI